MMNPSLDPVWAQLRVLLFQGELSLWLKQVFKNNLEFLDENPLGVGALSGTSFKIDRNYTTKKLKFKKPTKNSVDTVSDRDFVLDFLYSSLACSLHISRIAEELIIWNSDAFNMITLNDKLVTGSSIMPQKKNPDPLEYLRGKTGIFIGNINSMISILKVREFIVLINYLKLLLCLRKMWNTLLQKTK